MQMGYNLLYSVWKYSFDADCSLFLKILKGDIKEDVYLQQINLQVCATPLPPPASTFRVPPYHAVTWQPA